MSMLFFSSELTSASAAAALGDVVDAMLTSGAAPLSPRSGLHSRTTYTIAAVMMEVSIATLMMFFICMATRISNAVSIQGVVRGSFSQMQHIGMRSVTNAATSAT